MKKFFIQVLSLSLVLILLSGCGTSTDSGTSMEKQQKQVYAMDTVILLTCYGDCAEAALTAAEARLLELQADLDPEEEGGSVYRVNRNAGTFVPVSEDCYAICAAALEVRERSGGALEPAMYNLINAWGFIADDFRVPSDAEIFGLLAEIEACEITLDSDSLSVRVSEGCQISFGAVAKGYSAQAALEAMAQAGAEYAIVSLGGNVQTLGETKPNGASWKVAVTDPEDPGDYLAMLTLGEKAIVTSGGYQRYFEQDGVTYIHILDPETGYPADSGLTSVTIVCEEGVEADALSTAMFVLGEEKALDYWRTYGGFEMILVTEDRRVIVTPGLTDCFEEDADYLYEYLEN